MNFNDLPLKQRTKMNNFLRDYFKDAPVNNRYNVLRINGGNTDAHEIMKLRIMLEHIRMGHIVIAEAEFQGFVCGFCFRAVLRKDVSSDCPGCGKVGLPINRGRCDVACLTCEEIYEVVASEEEASLVMKNKKYPIPPTIIRVKI